MWKVRILACVVFASFLPSLASCSQDFDPSNEMVNSIHRLNHNAIKLSDMPLEVTISRRMSIRSIDIEKPVPWELVSEVLWAACGYSLQGRTIPTLCGYPVVIYVCNEAAAYKFVPENQSVAIWIEGDYREVGGGSSAPIQLYIALDTDICQDVVWGVAELGCAVQGIYLMANSLNLGTVCQSRSFEEDRVLHEELGLPESENVFYKMPLGYPLSPYIDYQNLVPASRPSSAELPQIEDSSVALKEALDSVLSSHEWSQDPVTMQELSQILWASYGFSYYEDTAPTPPRSIARHRTVPSAHAYYPMKVYVADSSGVHQYIPEQHTLSLVSMEDRRLGIAQASGNQWASSAPLIVVLVWNQSRTPTDGYYAYTEVGLITQNVFLESAAWGLIADWGRADSDAGAMRESLGLVGATDLHPISVITLGHRSITETTTTTMTSTPTLTTTTSPTTPTSLTTSISTSPASTATATTTETPTVTPTTTEATTYTTTAPPPTSIWMEWWFWTIVGVAAVLLVIGVVWKLRRGSQNRPTDLRWEDVV